MVNPAHIEQMVKTLRRLGVSRYKDSQMELELIQHEPAPLPEDYPEPKQDRGVEEVDMAYSHLGFDPEKMFPSKPE